MEKNAFRNKFQVVAEEEKEEGEFVVGKETNTLQEVEATMSHLLTIWKSKWLKSLQFELIQKQDQIPGLTMEVLAPSLRQGKHQKKSKKNPMKNQNRYLKKEEDLIKLSENRKQQGKEQ